VVGVVVAVIGVITAVLWSTLRSEVQGAVAPEILLALADKQPPAQRVKVLAGPAAQGTGIPVAVEVLVVRVPAILLMGDPACWFRFWVAIFTGAVVVEDLGIPSVAETVELEEEVVERLIQTAEELG
jgi:hypothetical protein